MPILNKTPKEQLHAAAKELLSCGHLDLGKHKLAFRFGKSIKHVNLALAKARMAGASQQEDALTEALRKVLKAKD